MTKSEKLKRRVELARDVLLKLDAKEILPEFACYGARDEAGCHVCALGSMLVACCGADAIPAGLFGADEDNIVECLTPLFSLGDLVVIEAAFEGAEHMPMVSEWLSRKNADELSPTLEAKVSRAANFAPEHSDATKRLRAIMSNLITNNGEFRP